MARENYLNGTERPLPYWVRLVMVDDSDTRMRQARPMLMYLDLRGGEFTRPTHSRLADVFDWLTRAFRVGQDHAVNYALEITPMPRQDDEEITGGHTPYIPDDWPELQKRSFLWLPVPYGDDERRYAWQK